MTQIRKWMHHCHSSSMVGGKEKRERSEKGSYNNLARWNWKEWKTSLSLEWQSMPDKVGTGRPILGSCYLIGITKERQMSGQSQNGYGFVWPRGADKKENRLRYGLSFYHIISWRKEKAGIFVLCKYLASESNSNQKNTKFDMEKKLLTIHTDGISFLLFRV